MNESEKRKGHFPLWIIMIAVGFVLIIIGIAIGRAVGIDKYFPTEDINRSFDGTQVSSIKIESGVGTINILKANDNLIHVDGKDLPEGRYDVKADNGKFELLYKNVNWFSRWYGESWLFNNNISPEITIYLPEKEYESFDFDGGVGENNINGLTVKTADIDCGVGENIFKNFTVLGDADIDFGVGDNRFENCTLHKSDIDTGVGEVNFSGRILGDTDIDCGIGEAEFNIDGYKNEYDINYDKGVGEVNINSTQISDFSGKPIKLDIDCGVGEITINFK